MGLVNSETGGAFTGHSARQETEDQRREEYEAKREAANAEIQRTIDAAEAYRRESGGQDGDYVSARHADIRAYTEDPSHGEAAREAGRKSKGGSKAKKDE